MLIEHISVSRKGVFEQCQQMYKFKYHLKTPSPVAEQFYFTYGKIIHKIAELYVENKEKVKISDICSDILTKKIPFDEYGDDKFYAPELPPEYKSRLKNHLFHIANLTSKIGTEGFLEWEFNYDLDPPNNKIIKGFIDRLFEKNGQYFILDYKTTKSSFYRKDKTTIKKDLQLNMYARIVQKTFNVDAKNITAALYYLDEGQLVSTGFNNQYIEQVEKEVLNSYNEIAAFNPDKVMGSVSQQCFRCDYHTICPFTKLF